MSPADRDRWSSTIVLDRTAVRSLERTVVRAHTKLRAERELRAVNAALNFTQGKRHASWRDYLEWLEVSIDSALRHAVQS